jgi:hypothetical protein
MASVPAMHEKVHPYTEDQQQEQDRVAGQKMDSVLVGKQEPRDGKKDDEDDARRRAP